MLDKPLSELAEKYVQEFPAIVTLENIQYGMVYGPKIVAIDPKFGWQFSRYAATVRELTRE